MASVQERRMARGRTAWRMHYRWRGKQESFTFDTEDEASYWEKIFNNAGVEAGLKLYAQTLAPEEPALSSRPAPETVRQVVEHHIKHLTGVTDGTRENYRLEAGRDIYPMLGDLAVTAIDGDLAAGWVNSLSARNRKVGTVERGPLSAKSIKNRHALLSAAMARAVARGHIASNPFHGLALPEGDDEEMAFLSEAEWWIVHDSLAPRWQPLATFLVGTGLRWGEATALRVKDVQLDHGRLRVAQAWKTRGGAKRVLGPPKSKAGKRWVPFDEPVAKVLQPLLRERSGDDLVFVNSGGRPILNNSFHSRGWGPAMKVARAAGLQQHVRPHDLRHTFASWQLESGEVSLFSLAVVIGHDDLKLLRKRYGHLMPDASASVARVAGAKLRRPAQLRSVAG